jgi:hypothetical protein
VRVLPSTVTASSLPPTGPPSVATWPVVAGMLAVGAVAIAVSRIPRRHPG